MLSERMLRVTGERQARSIISIHATLDEIEAGIDLMRQALLLGRHIGSPYTEELLTHAGRLVAIVAAYNATGALVTDAASETGE